MNAVMLMALLCGAAPSGVQIVWVDLQRAILGTEDGQKVKAALAGEHQRLIREIRGKEERLIYEKAKMGPARYAEEVQKLEAEIGKRQDELEKKQDVLLEPIIEKMRGILVGHRKSGLEPIIIEISDSPPVIPSNECDLTSWLIRAHTAPSIGAPKPLKECRYGKVVYVSFDRALAASSAGKAATAELDGFEQRGQADLDLLQKKLDAAVSVADKERKKDELAALYQKYQKELERKELETEKRLYGKIESVIGTSAKARPTYLFLELLEDTGARIDPSCDATDWAAGVVDDKVADKDLDRLCK